MSFGKILKRILEEKEITQTELAKKLNCGHAVINRWIKGRSNNPKFESIEKVSKALDVPISYFLEDDKAQISQNMIQNQQNIKEQNDNNILNLVIKLIEEKDARYRSEMDLIKKDIENIKEKLIIKNAE